MSKLYYLLFVFGFTFISIISRVEGQKGLSALFIVLSKSTLKKYYRFELASQSDIL